MTHTDDFGISVNMQLSYEEAVSIGFATEHP